MDIINNNIIPILEENALDVEVLKNFVSEQSVYEDLQEGETLEDKIGVFRDSFGSTLDTIESAKIMLDFLGADD